MNVPLLSYQEVCLQISPEARRTGTTELLDEIQFGEVKMYVSHVYDCTASRITLSSDTRIFFCGTLNYSTTPVISPSASFPRAVVAFAPE